MARDRSQEAFDGAERIADALYMLDGMIAVLETELTAAPLGGREGRVLPLVGAMRFYRAEAAREADALARSQAG